MVIRRTNPAGVITQPAHAWLAGQIGRAWGNEVFRRPPLWDELIFTTDQHDVGFLDWERNPTIEPASGWPHDYLTLPYQEHLRLWRTGIARMLPVLRFAALLISRHAAGLYRRHFDWHTASQAEQDAVAQFIEDQASFERELLPALTRLDRYAELEAETSRRAYSFLLGTWDLISLHLCEGTGEDLELDETPTLCGPARIRLSRGSESDEEWRVRPWPFAVPVVDLQVQQRQIDPPYTSDEALRQNLAESPLEERFFRLVLHPEAR